MSVRGNTAPNQKEDKTMTITYTPNIGGAPFPLSFNNDDVTDAMVDAWAALANTDHVTVTDGDGVDTVTAASIDTDTADTAAAVWAPLGHGRTAAVTALKSAASVNLGDAATVWATSGVNIPAMLASIGTATAIVGRPADGKTATVKLTADEKQTLSISTLLSACAAIRPADSGMVELAALATATADTIVGVDITATAYTSRVDQLVKQAVKRTSGGSGEKAAASGAVVTAIDDIVGGADEPTTNTDIAKQTPHTVGAVGARWSNAVAVANSTDAAPLALGDITDDWLDANPDWQNDNPATPSGQSVCVLIETGKKATRGFAPATV